MARGAIVSKMETVDITTGMVLELRSGNHGIVMENNGSTLEVDIRGENSTHTIRACDVLIAWPSVRLECGTIWDYTAPEYDYYKYISHTPSEIEELETYQEENHEH